LHCETRNQPKAVNETDSNLFMEQGPK